MVIGQLLAKLWPENVKNHQVNRSNHEGWVLIMGFTEVDSGKPSKRSIILCNFISKHVNKLIRMNDTQETLALFTSKVPIIFLPF